MKRNFDFSVFAVAAITITVIFVNFNVKYWNKPNKVIIWDVVSYYAYLPAALIYNDLTFNFYEPGHDPEVIFWPESTPEGKKVLKTSMGLSLLYLPFFICGHIVALISSYPANGFSTPYKFFLVWSSIIYVITSLFILRKVLARYFNQWVIGFTFLAVFFGTNLFYYTTYESTMPHAYNFFLFALILYLTISWWKNPSYKLSIYLGLAVGLAVLVRPTNILVMLVFIFYGIKSFKEIIHRVEEFLKEWKHLIVIAIAALIVWIPQMIYWKYQTGQFLYFSYTGESFFFSNPQIINGLFSFRKGWLVYTPIMTFSLVGFVIIFRRYKGFFTPLLMFTVLNIYVAYSWWSWWYGGGFGSRAMIDSYALLAFPFAAFIQWSIEQKQIVKTIIFAILLLLAVHGIFQTYQYYHGAIHWDSMSRAAYLNSFGRLKPGYHFWDYLEPPDYEKAKQGEQAIVLHSKMIIENELFCDYETLSPDGQFILSTDKRFLLEKPGYRTGQMAFSGKFAVEITPDNRFASDLQIKVRKDEIYRVSAWRFPADSEGRIIFCASNEQDFYHAIGRVIQMNDEGWGKVEAEIEIPFDGNDPFKIYFYNPGNETVFFDDLKILKVK